MQVKRIAEGEHSAIILTFIKLPFVIKIFVLSILNAVLHRFTAFLNFKSLGNNTLSARGGLGGIGANMGCGGNGSPGRIRIDSTVFSGNVSAENGKVVKKSLKNLFFVSQTYIL